MDTITAIPEYGTKRLDSGTNRNAVTINGIIVSLYRTAKRAADEAEGMRSFAELLGKESATSKMYRERYGIELAPAEPAPVVKTEVIHPTYFGVPTNVTIEWHEKNFTFGDRTITTEWLDDADPRNGGHKAGTVTRRRVKGHAVIDPEHFVVIEAEEVVR